MDAVFSIFKEIYNVLIGLEHFKRDFQPFKKETRYKITIKWITLNTIVTGGTGGTIVSAADEKR